MKICEIQEATTEYDGIVQAERERPEPGADEALVRIRACSLKAQDLGLANPERAFGPGPDFPVIPLSDGAGEVVAVGDDVNRLSEGDRVATRYAPNWVEGEGSKEKFTPFKGIAEGVLAEYVTASAESLAVLPDRLSYEEGATLPSAGVTAWHALVENGGVSADETVLVLGTGGVSTFALQFASMHGANAVVLSSSDEKLARARELGAWKTLNYEKTPEWGGVVADLTDGGVDHVVEVGGVGTLKQSLEAAAINGNVHVVGVADKEGDRDYAIHAYIHRPIFHKALNVRGIWGAGSRAMFDRMNRAIDATGMAPVIDRTFGFDEVRDAYRRLDSGANQGRVVITLP